MAKRRVTVKVFKSFEEADEAERRYYARLSMDYKFALVELLRQEHGFVTAYQINPDFRAMLGLLLKHRVRFVLVGGHAVGVHDRPRFTKDIDFFVEPSAPNARRLWDALAEFGAPLGRVSPKDFTIPTRVIQFGVAPNRIDFVMSIAGVTFAQAWRGRVTVRYARMSIPVLGRKHLIVNKRATGRPQDRVDADELERP